MGREINARREVLWRRRGIKGMEPRGLGREGDEIGTKNAGLMGIKGDKDLPKGSER